MRTARPWAAAGAPRLPSAGPPASAPRRGASSGSDATAGAAPAEGSRAPLWHAGESRCQELLARALRGERKSPARELREPGSGRRHLQVELGEGRSAFVKCCAAPRARRPGAEAWRSPRREWRWLRRLRARGLPVPAPLALGRLDSGETVLATEWQDGRSLAELASLPRPERRSTLNAVGEALRQLHAAGVVHGDLHADNVRLTPAGPVLLDLGRARRGRSLRLRLRDLAYLEHSLGGGLSRSERLRLRATVLALRRPFDRGARRRLRAAERALERRATRHARRRTRSWLRPGRAVAALRVESWGGLRLAGVDPALVKGWLRAHRSAPASALLKRNARIRVSSVEWSGRRAVVKESRARGLRPLADALRGSAGRRAWRAGHGLAVRGVGAARPLAYLERRRFGLPWSSLVVLEDLSPDLPADRVTDRPDVWVAGLVGLLRDLHRAAADHGDLKASHIFLGHARGPRLVDLEGVRFRRRLSERRRLRALAQLNASLPDAIPAELRLRGFRRYAAALPFRAPERQVLGRLVRLSLSRRHRWTGSDCECLRK